MWLLWQVTRVAPSYHTDGHWHIAAPDLYLAAWYGPRAWAGEASITPLQHVPPASSCVLRGRKHSGAAWALRSGTEPALKIPHQKKKLLSGPCTCQSYKNGRCVERPAVTAQHGHTNNSYGAFAFMISVDPPADPPQVDESLPVFVHHPLHPTLRLLVCNSVSHGQAARSCASPCIHVPAPPSVWLS